MDVRTKQMRRTTLYFGADTTHNIKPHAQGTSSTPSESQVTQELLKHVAAMELQNQELQKQLIEAARQNETQATVLQAQMSTLQQRHMQGGSSSPPTQNVLQSLPWGAAEPSLQGTTPFGLPRSTRLIDQTRSAQSQSQLPLGTRASLVPQH